MFLKRFLINFISRLHVKDMTSTNYVCDSDYLLHKSKDFCKESQTPYFEKCRKIPEPNENHIIFNKFNIDINYYL